MEKRARTADGKMSDPGEIRAPAAVRRRILDAARHCFETYGVAKTTMLDVAHRAGLSRRAVYNHFAGKEDILSAIGDDVVMQLQRQVSASIEIKAGAAGILTAAIASAAELAHRSTFARTSILQGDPIVLASHLNSSIHDFLRMRWSRFFAVAEARGELAQDIGLDDMVRWITYAHGILQPYLATGHHDPARLRVFVRSFVVEPLLRSNLTASAANDRGFGDFALPEEQPPTPSGIEDRIIAAGRSILADRAIATVKVGEIASAAGISRAVVYKYFPDKATLHHRVVQSIMGSNLSRIARLMSAGNLNFDAFASQSMERILHEAQENYDVRASLMDPPSETGTAHQLLRLFWMRALEHYRPGFAPGLAEEDVLDWLVHSQRIVRFRAHTVAENRISLQKFIWRWIVRPMLA